MDHTPVRYSAADIYEVITTLYQQLPEACRRQIRLRLDTIDSVDARTAICVQPHSEPATHDPPARDQRLCGLEGHRPSPNYVCFCSECIIAARVRRHNLPSPYSR